MRVWGSGECARTELMSHKNGECFDMLSVSQSKAKAPSALVYALGTNVTNHIGSKGWHGMCLHIWRFTFPMQGLECGGFWLICRWHVVRWDLIATKFIWQLKFPDISSSLYMVHWRLRVFLCIHLEMLHFCSWKLFLFLRTKTKFTNFFVSYACLVFFFFKITFLFFVFLETKNDEMLRNTIIFNFVWKQII